MHISGVLILIVKYFNRFKHPSFLEVGQHQERLLHRNGYYSECCEHAPRRRRTRSRPGCHSCRHRTLSRRSAGRAERRPLSSTDRPCLRPAVRGSPSSNGWGPRRSSIPAHAVSFPLSGFLASPLRWTSHISNSECGSTGDTSYHTSPCPHGNCPPEDASCRFYRTILGALFTSLNITH